MKNLHKAMLSIASVAITLSSGAFAMDPDGDDVPCSASTSRAGTSAAAASARGHEMLPFEGEETYEQWLERRLGAFASSQLFSALPADKRDPLLNLSLRDHIARWQETPKLFYSPLMEADSRMKVIRAFNAELAILWFEKDTVANLVKKQNREQKTNDLERLIEETEELYDLKFSLIKLMGQGIVSEIVEDLMKAQAHEIQQKEEYFRQLKKRWSAEYEYQERVLGERWKAAYAEKELRERTEGRSAAAKNSFGEMVWGLPPVLERYGTHNTKIDLTVLGIAEHFCTAQIHQNKAWREDLRTHELFKREGLLHDLELVKREMDELYKRGIDELYKREDLSMHTLDKKEDLPRMYELVEREMPELVKRGMHKLGKREALLRKELSKLKTPVSLYNELAQEQFLEEREAEAKKQRRAQDIAAFAEWSRDLGRRFSLGKQAPKYLREIKNYR